MDILKITAEKVFGGAGVYGLKATAWFETDDGDEMTAAYVTDGADGGFAVYDGLLDSVDDEKPIEDYDEEPSDSAYSGVFEAMKKAVTIVDE